MGVLGVAARCHGSLRRRVGHACASERRTSTQQRHMERFREDGVDPSCITWTFELLKAHRSRDSEIKCERETHWQPPSLSHIQSPTNIIPPSWQRLFSLEMTIFHHCKLESDTKTLSVDKNMSCASRWLPLCKRYRVCLAFSFWGGTGRAERHRVRPLRFLLWQLPNKFGKIIIVSTFTSGSSLLCVTWVVERRKMGERGGRRGLCRGLSRK